MKELNIRASMRRCALLCAAMLFGFHAYGQAVNYGTGLLLPPIQDGRANCSVVMIKCPQDPAQSPSSQSNEAKQEAQERARVRENLRENEEMLEQDIEFARQHPDTIVVEGQRIQPAKKQRSIEKILDDALGDHSPEGLTRTYYDAYGNRHEIVNKCWGPFC